MVKNITATPAKAPLQLIAGDDWEITIAIKDSNIVKNVTGYTFFAGVDNLIDTPITCTVLDAVNGTIKLTIDAQTTENLLDFSQDARKTGAIPFWWLRWIDPASKTRSLLSGEFEIFAVNENPSVRPLQVSTYDLVITQGTISLNILGAQGIAGASGNGYNHTQASAATVWTIPHNLGFRPNVESFTVGGVQMIGDLLHLNVNTLTITFLSAVSGYARCS